MHVSSGKSPFSTVETCTIAKCSLKLHYTEIAGSVSRHNALSCYKCENYATKRTKSVCIGSIATSKCDAASLMPYYQLNVLRINCLPQVFSWVLPFQWLKFKWFHYPKKWQHRLKWAMFKKGITFMCYMPFKHNVNVCIWTIAFQLISMVSMESLNTSIAVNPCKWHENSKSTKLLWNNMINESNRFENLWCVVWFIIAYVACFVNHITNGIQTQSMPKTIIERCYCAFAYKLSWYAAQCNVSEFKQTDIVHSKWNPLTLESWWPE